MSADSSLPLVSIVTPSYNQAAYLEDTMQSVFLQEYPTLEYIVVDGGSEDGSLEIIKKYTDRLTWWVYEKDEGQAQAINKGLQRASGEIVAWLNSDDLYLPGAVMSAVEALQTDREVGMVFGNAITIDENGRPIKELIFPQWSLEQLMGFRIICQPAVFMRRAALERVGLLDSTYHYMLDHHLWLRIAAHLPVKHVPVIWAAARHHPAAKNVAQPLEFGRETLHLLEWMQSEPDLASKVAKNQRQIQAGAYRLTARYLLDGGLPKEALQTYGKAILARPGFALKHWHRMVFALLSLIGVGSLSKWYYQLRDARRPELKFEPEISAWPGLCLEHQHQ